MPTRPLIKLPILNEARACRTCESALPNEPRPLLAASASSRILIIGQAPGQIAHETGVPLNDASGKRLRDWLGVTAAQFYDPALIALVPMGFCFPGKSKGGDMAPRPDRAPLWHPKSWPRSKTSSSPSTSAASRLITICPTSPKPSPTPSALQPSCSQTACSCRTLRLEIRCGSPKTPGSPATCRRCSGSASAACLRVPNHPSVELRARPPPRQTHPTTGSSADFAS